MTATGDVSAIVDRITNGQQGTADTVDALNGSTEQRIVTAQALVEVARNNPTRLTEHPEPLVESLAEQILARPIADSLLGAAYDLTAEIDEEIIPRGTVNALDKAHECLDDLVVSENQVPGGGAGEIALANELRDYAGHLSGRKPLAVEAIADALEAVPRTMARQARIDPVETVVEMRGSSLRGEFIGVDIKNGRTADATSEALLEPHSALKARITGGVALGMVVFRAYGTVSPLHALAGYDPVPSND